MPVKADSEKTAKKEGGGGVKSVIVGVIVVAFAVAVALTASRGKKSPNVILIVSETLRADHLGCYGYGRDTSNFLDGLAKQSVLFRRSYSQAPCTVPSMWNILLSKYASHVPALSDSITMAEYFKHRQYRTAAFLSHVFLDAEKTNLHQGFDTYEILRRDDRKKVYAPLKAWSVTRAAIEWIDGVREDPFFLFLVYFDPHDPYEPPGKFRNHFNETDAFGGDRRRQKIHGRRKENKAVSDEHRTFLVNAYDEEIRYLDSELENLMSFLGDVDEFDDSIIIVTSDHGEELGDNGARWDHCQLLSREELWVPLIIKMPGQEYPLVVHEPVQTIDIFPTLVEYFSGPALPLFFGNLEGTSLLRLIGGQPGQEGRTAASFWTRQRCIVQGNVKYWEKGGTATLTDVDTNEDVKNEALKQELKQKLDLVFETHVLKEDPKEKPAAGLDTDGYLEEIFESSR
ncbi:MAG: sulfatase [Pseudomonadota bacterium]